MLQRIGSRARSAFGIAVVAATLTAIAWPLTFAPTPAAAEDDCAPGVMARIPGPPPVLATIDAAPGELDYTGAGVTVAIVDSGVDATRPQLAEAFAPGSISLVGDEERPDGLGDPHGHGTAIAGIIAARAAPGSGVIGIAPESHIVSIRVFRGDDDQSKKDGFGPEAARLAAGIRTAVDVGSQIIVVALSDDEDTSGLRDAAEYAFAHGSLIVASAGNRSTTSNTEDSPRYPASYPGTVAVTGVNTDGRPTDDSIHGAHIDLAAPGQSVLTTATGGGDCMYANDAPSASFSTAYVAGAAALLAEAYPLEGPTGWAYRLEATADRANPDVRDDLSGWGTLRVAAALKLRPDRNTRGPESPFADTSGSAILTPSVKVTPDTTPDKSPAVFIAVAAGIGGVVLVFALTAQLRRRRAEVAAEPLSSAAQDDDLDDFEDGV